MSKWNASIKISLLVENVEVNKLNDFIESVTAGCMVEFADLCGADCSINEINVSIPEVHISGVKNE